MSDQPFFSVIVPVYNKEKYVSRAISSILNQSFGNFELIIVCDPSTDNSNFEVSKFNDSRLKIFYRDKPGPGGYAARNLGIDNSNGQWITFLDADDVWYSNHLDETRKNIEKYRDIRLFTSARKIEENGQVYLDKFSALWSEESKLLTFADSLYYSFIDDKPFHTNSVVIKRDLLSTFNTKLFPDGETHRSGDLYAWVMLAHYAKKFIWSSHLSSYLYKDVVGVSKTSFPDININKKMVSRICSECDANELFLLKRYANKLIRIAWFEQRKYGIQTNSLFYELYWQGNFLYCSFWLVISFLPIWLQNTLRKINILFRS